MFLRFYLLSLLVFSFSFGSFVAQGQENPETPKVTSDADALLKMASKFEEKQRIDSAKIAKLKERFGESLVMEVNDNGKVTKLVRFDDLGFPEFYETHNSNAAATTNTDDVHPFGGAGFSLTGSGIEIGEWDGGGVRGTHQELTGRVTQVDSPGSFSDHATHVAGTMLAGGVNTSAKGMAYQATLKAHDFSNDESEMATYAATANAIISNHSYGTITGWYYNSGASAWYWYGTPSISQTEDYYFGFYNYWAYVWDTIANAAPNYLIVKSAGNDRNDNISAAANDTHYVWSSGWTLSTQTRAADCPTGYDCISTTGNAKNILTIGAVNDISSGYSQPSNVVMSSFSGWGPTDDGRIKPDISGNGVSLYSSGSQSNNDYYSSSGTSMSAPNVTGSLALIQEYYDDQNSSFMLSSALKGLVIHTANEAGSANGPDYKFGWGLLDTRGAVEHIDDTNSIITWDNLSNGDSLVYNYYFDGNDPLIATICWNDPAGTPTTAQLDPTTLMLVNDLDLRVINDSSSIEYEPWILNPASPSSAATTGDNFRDNVEKIEIASPDPGFYTIKIKHKGTLTAPQQVSLILSRKADPPVICVTTTSSISEDICQGQTYVSPGGNNYTSSAIFNDTILNAAGCDSVITVTLNVSDPQFSLSSTGSGCGGSAGAIQTTISSGTSPYSYLWSNGATTQNLSSLSSGTYTLTITDALGCTEAEAITINTTVDNTPPTVVSQNITAYLDASGNAAINALMVDNGSTDNCSISSLSLNDSVFDCSDIGTNNVLLTATDPSGNSADANAVITVADTTTPNVITQNITLNLDATGNAIATPAQIDNGSTDNCSISSTTLSQTAFDCSDVGSNAVTLAVTDAAGNSGTASATVTVVDTFAPIVLAQNINVYLDASGNVTVTGAQVNNGSTDNCGISSVALTPNSFTCADIGSNNASLSVMDLSGNSATASAVITVIDSMAPTLNTTSINIPIDLNGEATLSQSLLAPNVSDNCGVDSIGISQTVFDCDDIGQNVSVLATVVDESGNVAQQMITVVVSDEDDPIVQTQPATIYLNGSGVASVSPSLVIDTAYDNCGIDQLLVTPGSFGCSAVGNVVVTVFASDAFGNTTTANAQVSIADTNSPDLITQSPTVYLDLNGMGTMTTQEVDNGSTDNCGIASYSISDSIFTCEDEGMNVITFSAIDINGNEASQTVEVIVIDTFNKISEFQYQSDLTSGTNDTVSVELAPGASYQWSVTNGSVVTQNLNVAIVNYTTGPTANLQVVQVSEAGCLDTARRKINVWPLSVDELAEQKIVYEVFPNPTNDVLNVRLVSGTGGEKQFQIFDQLGQLVMEKAIPKMENTATHEFQLGHLSRGVYILKLSAENYLGSFRIIVQ
ncbi:MAG: S8 family serine peptidase [Salibacteraceae bacterium]